MTSLSLAIIVVLVAVVTVGVAVVLRRGPDLSRYEPLRDPAVRTMPAQRMLVVESTGDPNAASAATVKKLFRTWYGLRGRKGPPSLRARWPKGLDAPKETWIGIYGMPLPDSIIALPPRKEADGPAVRIETWEYGEVAEILHVGPHSTERPTIDRLHAFIRDSGLRIVGDHEEEYVRGPGMFGPGNPAGYHTVIRYRVAKP